MILSGILWRIRGILGWPFNIAFGCVQAWTLWPALGKYALLAIPLIWLWEGPGWEPKHWDWVKKFPWNWEPDIKFLQNPKEFKLPFWKQPKYLLDWRGAWNEVYFGVIFNIILQVGIYGIF